tara:strand:+ start:614 stop:1012 length:399 start_codon:yes stop_codon:yes gene_type:complete
MSNLNKHNNPWGMELNQYCMLMHLSQFSDFFIPFGGIVIPIVMWYVNKDEYVEVDQHGKRIMNWIISSLIYTLIAISIFLFSIATESFLFISVGVLLLVALVVCSIVFTILGSTRSFKGEIYNYPMSINFIK